VHTLTLLFLAKTAARERKLVSCLENPSLTLSSKAPYSLTEGNSSKVVVP